MRREVFVAAAAVHLTIAALFSTHVRVDRILPGWVERPLRVYGGYTGADTHFNFFAPGVPSQPRVRFVLAMADGSRRDATLTTSSTEVNQRLANMFGFYEREFLRPVLVRCWAVYMLAQHPDATAVEVHVDILELPTIAEARAGKAASWVEVEKTVLARDEIS